MTPRGSCSSAVLADSRNVPKATDFTSTLSVVVVPTNGAALVRDIGGQIKGMVTRGSLSAATPGMPAC